MFLYTSVLMTKQYPVEFKVSKLFEKKINELLTYYLLRDESVTPENMTILLFIISILIINFRNIFFQFGIM